jgi:hypothetical protein
MSILPSLDWGQARCDGHRAAGALQDRHIDHSLIHLAGAATGLTECRDDARAVAIWSGLGVHRELIAAMSNKRTSKAEIMAVRLHV